ncbi:uncharacterized protein ANIA_01936 [Aspergillus nidulans FGSC A4]|uniref:Uncharacterized protein n=1 Tax=Emericella nidulans (strain FGSC A4 / ATCC 38163 / CBS 112.46 / NRRL 194 / M139) TaxID=227321 RepID=C8VKV8_EMENI|nr:hypothetical protein [Aspergillus nidulans FGSC A4]CBF85857.1 TPA: conserved hypothetical protein [Aspergillus nidulans FGSC A4]
MSPINSLWFKWKSLRLPWRRSFLVGHDLAGNTYWEFRDRLNAGRYRRILKPPPRTHYGDVEVSQPPSIQEQQEDLLRQQRIQLLADMQKKKWEAEQARLDAPTTQQPRPATQTSNPTMKAASNAPAPGSESKPQTNDPAQIKASAQGDPFFRPKDAPGEKWQPETWTPKPANR